MASIRKRLLGAYLGVLAGLSASAVALVVYTFNEREEQWRHDLSLRLARATVQSVQTAQASHDPATAPAPGLNDLLDALDPDHQVALALFNAQHQQLFQRAGRDVSPGALDSCRPAAPQAAAPAKPACATLTHQGLTVVALAPARQAAQHVAALLQRSFAMGLFLLWAATWVILLVANRISAPLRRLAEQSEQLLRLDQDAPIDVPRTNDEVQALAKVLERSRQQLRSQVFVDVLTGLYNRRYLLQAVDAEFQRQARSAACTLVMVIDIDHFKHVNDRHGHDVGDAVLAGVAVCLRRAVRAGDLLARFGGEEFVVVASVANAAESLALAQRVLEQVSGEAIATGTGDLLQVTVSIGLVTQAASSTSAGLPQARFHKLFKAADDGLYQAKRSGRNCVVAVDLGARQPAVSAEGQAVPA